MKRTTLVAGLKELRTTLLSTCALVSGGWNELALQEAIDILSSADCACEGKEPIAQFDDEMIWEVGAQCYSGEICLFIHHQGDRLPVRVILLPGEVLDDA